MAPPATTGCRGGQGNLALLPVGAIRSSGPWSLLQGWPTQSSPEPGSSLEPAGTELIRAGCRLL